MKHQHLTSKTALVSLLMSAGLLASGAAVAADDTSTTGVNDAAAQTQSSSPAAQAQPSSPAAATSTAPGAYVTFQESDQFLANHLIGMNVKNEHDKDEDVGKISDVILDRDGKASGFVVGVGGFLGMGQKDVGMPWDRIQSIDAKDKVVQVNATKDELKAAPEFKEAKKQ